MTRSRDVADTQDNLGGAVAPFVAGKNFVINGGFDIFQRGSLSTTSSAYGLDRWFQVSSGSGAAVTTTQQTTGVPLGSRYCGRVTTGASAGYGNQYQHIETSNVAPLWGKTVTVSVKLRRNSAFAGSLSFVLKKSATVDAGNGATWAAIGSATVTNTQLPTGTTSADWLTLSYSVAIPNDGTANSLQLGIEQSQVETSAYWEMAQCQLELGNVTTPFSRAGGSIGGELALCQRYYYRLGGDAAYQILGFGNARSTQIMDASVPFSVTMRVSPTSVDFSTLATIPNYGVGTPVSVSALSINTGGSSRFAGQVVATSSGTPFTQNSPYYLSTNNSTSGFLAFNAEL